MALPILMPKLGMTMEEGTVLSWQVERGGRIEKGAVLLVIESEKTEAEIEAPASGFLRHVYVEPDRTVPCGTLLAALADDPDEALDVDVFRREHDRLASPVAASGPAPAAARSAEAAPRARKAVAPAARKAARELGVDPERVPGTGPGGRVTREDVQAFAAARETLVSVADGVSLEVPSAGAGDPVVLLPGFGTDVAVFARQTPALARAYRVRGVNPRGVGRSDAPELASYPVDRAAADVAALLDAPTHVVGASLGAAVALELALGHPERVRSLTLVTPFVTVGARLRAVVALWLRLARETKPELLAAALLPWLFSSGTLGDEAAAGRLARGLAATLARVGPDALERTARGLAAWSGSRTGDLGRIGVPTLVIRGGDDLLTPGGEAIAAALPRARDLLIPGAGHAVALEEPDLVNEALLGHLEASR